MYLKRVIILCLTIVFFLFINFSSCNLFSPKPSILPSLTYEKNWQIFKTVSSRAIEDITTYQANGLVTDYLRRMIVNDSLLVVGELQYGLSFIDLNDLNDPKGKVKSFTGRDSSNASDRFGLSGFAINPLNDKIYAWYGYDIVDVEELKIISDLAPDFTHGGYSCSPKNRFVIDDGGNFWIGTSNLESDGTIDDSELSNGLFKISSDLTSSTSSHKFCTPYWQ